MFTLRCEPQRLVFSGLLVLFIASLTAGQISSISDSESQTGFGGINSIVGTVFGPSGRPVETRVRVRISSVTSGDRVMTTNETGNFAFRGLPNGSYTISIDKEKDFEPVSQVVDIRVFANSPPQTYTLNIKLAYKPGTQAKPAVINAQFANVPAAARTFYDKAIELGGKGDHQGAVEQLKLAIKEHPMFTLAYNEMGVQYLRLNQLENADEAFQGALKIDPASFEALVNRGIAIVTMKRYGEAIPVLRKAVGINGQSAIAHYFLGHALANLGLFAEAEKEMVAALKLDPEKMKEGRRILAIIYADRGDKKLAADELEAYLKVTPDAADADKLKEMIKQLRSAKN